MKKVVGTSLTNNIISALSANFWVAIIGFTGSFIFPKILTIDAYAMYQTFTLYVGYIAILHLGFSSGMVLKYAGSEYDTIDRRQYKAEIIILIIILSVFTFIFGTIFLITQNKMVGYITLVIIPVGIINSYKSLFQAWNRFKTFAHISTSVATSIPVLAFIYYLIRNVLLADIYICIYIAVYWIVSIILLYFAIIKVRDVKREKILTKANWETEKTGFMLVLGNYVNTLFVSADKQFVKIFFNNSEFAFYSFGMSMQSLMKVFISSIAQPLFPAMAQGKFSDKEYNKIKDLLLVFGSFSGSAYFVTSFIVNHFIEKYIGSLKVVEIYFMVFPAMAVIHCLYINLYKIKGLMRTYIFTLLAILLITVVLNLIFIFAFGQFTGVAIATTITYYIWFIIGFVQFNFLKLSFKNIIHLIIYMFGFLLITRNMGDVIGCITYFLFVSVIAFIFYKDEILESRGILKVVRSRSRKK